MNELHCWEPIRLQWAIDLKADAKKGFKHLLWVEYITLRPVHVCAIYESKTWHWRWFLLYYSLHSQSGVTIQQPACWAVPPGSSLAGTVTVTNASALGPQTQTQIQSQVCKIMSSFSFTEQPPKTLHTPKYFQKFFFSLQTLEIDKRIQRRQNDSVLKASPFFHRKFCWIFNLECLSPVLLTVYL